ncbi:hypothetical protein TWF718_011114 [Orbilia javanica]|uniref:F-box domain-containing protein n=1 Tax=Orbilia javanica TaxID=47235 RepID=A0AAN8MLJ5_9PEZI
MPSPFLTCPLEMAREIFSHVPMQDMANIRLLSKAHDDIYIHEYWDSVTIKIIPTSQRIHDLVQTLRDSKKEVPRIRNLIIYGSTFPVYPQDPPQYDPSVGDHLVELFSLMATRKITFQFIHKVLKAPGYWKLVMDAIVKNGPTELESISQEFYTLLGKQRCFGVPFSKFKMSNSLMRSYKTTLTHLTSLQITTGDQELKPELTKRFWKFVGNIGENIEVLNVTASSKQRGPWPTPRARALGMVHQRRQPAGGYFYESCDLPQLKSLSLTECYLTVEDLKELLKKPEQLRALNITSCQMDEPIVDWFLFLKHLATVELRNLQIFSLTPRSEFQDRNNGKNIWDLPTITMKGDWATSLSEVQLHDGSHQPQPSSKNILRILSFFPTSVFAGAFWTHLTDGLWRDYRNPAVAN